MGPEEEKALDKQENVEADVNVPMGETLTRDIKEKKKDLGTVAEVVLDVVISLVEELFD